MVNIENADLYTQKMQTIGFSAGQTNAAEFVQTMMNFPSFPDMLKLVIAQEGMTVTV